MDESLKVFGKSTGCEVRIGVHLLEIGVTERNDVFVRCQNTAATDIAGTGFGFPLEGGLDFRGCDRPPEDAGKSVSDRGLELALDPVDQTHVPLPRFVSVVQM